jgi:hypothetical protein
MIFVVFIQFVGFLFFFPTELIVLSNNFLLTGVLATQKEKRSDGLAGFFPGGWHQDRHYEHA